ncbi:YcgL domain-containing protein [Mangrovimicrobium sediminis]|uniref:YcgL domain-containing protein E4634_11135 n=1 Tax=Mangrovimicrobium sediminis TaxID=2562682 RepID=A0A4Z0M1Z8_9GAMM|nr:YcgL domain-containing protein [Haliea sp. SAOS-164]TGD73571.1 YcgL domain-containing protein [Haliea sp. SAOS-164]
MKRLVEIFRSSRKDEMYLYVDRARGLADVPEPLLQQFGEPTSVMSLMLEPARKLARADAAEVLAKIEAQGFYLQMPPTAEELLRRERAGETGERD